MILLFAVQWQISQIPYSVYFSSEKVELSYDNLLLL